MAAPITAALSTNSCNVGDTIQITLGAGTGTFENACVFDDNGASGNYDATCGTVNPPDSIVLNWTASSPGTINFFANGDSGGDAEWQTASFVVVTDALTPLYISVTLNKSIGDCGSEFVITLTNTNDDSSGNAFYVTPDDTGLGTFVGLDDGTGIYVGTSSSGYGTSRILKWIAGPVASDFVMSFSCDGSGIGFDVSLDQPELITTKNKSGGFSATF